MNRLRRPLVVLAATAASQVGHLVAYLARFGGNGLYVGTAGSHAYLPVLAGSVVSLAAIAVLLGLLVIAGARLLRGRRLGRRARRPGLPFELVAILFTIQLAIFVGQETAEGLWAGAPATSLLDLVLWGAAGQLPLAVLAALVVSWLWVRFDVALSQLRCRRIQLRPAPLVPAVLSPLLKPAQPLLISAPAVFVKRGPPLTLFVGS